jgi:putative phosphonate metabolism protein
VTARYAVYYAPRRGSQLWAKASAWLGRDAYDGRSLQRPDLPGLEGLDLDALTSDPRGYGFHATLKAPFELAVGRSEVELIAFASDFAARRRAFEAEIEAGAIGSFQAFRLRDPSQDMDDLHAACVREFDAFRAPISEHDLARRRRAGLSPTEDERLVRWGYPYIFEDFRFHMTLTGSLRDPSLSERVHAALSAWFRDEAGRHRFDGVAIFKQEDRASPFVIIARADFA